MKNRIDHVPRYFEPHVNDCFSNAYATVLLYKGLNPNIILADYLSFMYDEKEETIGVNFMLHFSTSVEFTEEQLNTSLEFVYFPATSVYDPNQKIDSEKYKDKIKIQMWIHDDPEVAHNRLKELIDSDHPVIAFVDLHEMSYHRAYQKEHGLHSVVITGYDDEEQMYDIFDIYKLSSSDFDGRLSYKEIQQGRQSINPLSNPLIGNQYRPVRNLWIEIEKGTQFSYSTQKIWAIIEESCRRMLGQKNVLGHQCGLERLRAFRRDLIRKKEKEFDEKEIFRFRNNFLNYKSIGRNRDRFNVFLSEVKEVLPDNWREIAEGLEQSAKLWEICASLSLKIGLTKQARFLDNLDKQLSAIIDIESRVVDQLTQWVMSGMNRSQVAVSKEGGE